MGSEPTSLRDLTGRANHWATGDSKVSKGEMWNRIARSHNQIMTWYLWTQNCIAHFKNMADDYTSTLSLHEYIIPLKVSTKKAW